MLEYYDSTRPRIRKMGQSYKSWSIYSYKEYKRLLKSLWARLKNPRMSYTNTVNGTLLQRSGLQKIKKKSRKQKQSDRVPTKKVPLVDDESPFGENIDFESRPASSCTTEYIHSFCPSSHDLAVLGMFLHRIRSEKKRLKNLQIFLSQTRT